ncbi:hypothetical protein [Kitasatospora sp. McL0602]|uniref:hypothetical protein n=1 Tax=Kitasatospora sp. McL0602 TaxID=3439530 RepID=UPI003F8C63E3
MSSSLAGLRWRPRSAALLAIVTIGIAAVFCALPVDRADGHSGPAAPPTARVHQTGHSRSETRQVSLPGSGAAPGRAGLRQLRHLFGALHASALCPGCPAAK